MKIIQKIKAFLTGPSKAVAPTIPSNDCQPESAPELPKEPAIFDATLLQDLHEAVAEDRRKQLLAILIKDIDKRIWSDFPSKKETNISFTVYYSPLNLRHWFGSYRVLMEKYLKPEYEKRKFKVSVSDFSSMISISWQ